MPTQKNYFRHFLGRLHRPQDFQFIVDGMTRILNQPLQANASYILGRSHPSGLRPTSSCSSGRSPSAISGSDPSSLIPSGRMTLSFRSLFYAPEYKSDASKQGVVRMCAFLLQTLSVEKNFGANSKQDVRGAGNSSACDPDSWIPRNICRLPHSGEYFSSPTGETVSLTVGRS